MRFGKNVILIILICSLANFAVNLLIPLVHATYVEYPSLVSHEWNDEASSLYVIGTVILYEHVNLDGRSVSYTNADVILEDDNFDDITSSLKINGIVKLSDEPSGGGWRHIVFSSDALPDDTWGTTWNENPNLVKNSGGWDVRPWRWGIGVVGGLDIDAPDSNNYVNWENDGLVRSRAYDVLETLMFKASNFDQGYEHYVSDRSPDLGEFKPDSLRVCGSVTLYDEPNYQGNNVSFTNENLESLGGWNDKAQSLIVDGTVTIWNYMLYVGSGLTFTRVSAQPTPLKVSDAVTIMLDGVVSNWASGGLLGDGASGIKLDVYLTTNHLDPEPLRIYMEFYLARNGFCEWGWGGGRENIAFSTDLVKAYRVAAGSWPEYINRIIYPGDIMRWNINVKPFIRRAVDLHGLDINDFYIAKIDFCTEADAFGVISSPWISADLHRLRLSYLTSSGGCPFVYVWNGTQYTIDNNILRDNARGNGTEVEDYYRLEQDLVPLYEGYFNSYYSLKISEFQQEHSYLDEVDLFAVDHATDVSVAVSPTGDILTYQSPHVPISAVDENDTSWLAELSEIDGEYYESYDGSFLVLNFGEVNSSDAKFILRADPPPDGPPTKRSIHIQVLNSPENWLEVVSIIPRTYWSTDIIDLSDYLPTEGELVVRLYFTDDHRVDFVGLDTTPQAETDIEDAYLLWAYHSEEVFVTAELCSDDDVYAELVPDQQITLLFRAPNPDDEARTFIFYVKGYYYTITG